MPTVHIYCEQGYVSGQVESTRASEGSMAREEETEEEKEAKREAAAKDETGDGEI